MTTARPAHVYDGRESAKTQPRHGREPAQGVNFIRSRQAAGQNTEDEYSTAAK
jgi:hypothetical protein